MSRLQTTDGDDLRAWLDKIQRKESSELLMIGLAYDAGVSKEEISNWFGYPVDEVTAAIEELNSQPLLLTIATREGVDFDRLAKTSGLAKNTVTQWFEGLESRPIAEAAEIIRRYGQRAPGPLLAGTESRLYYLNYDVIEENGWAIEDEMLFEKAADADLPLEDYGRFLVEPGQSILEAAEQRGQSWPYACRGGACANCAVIVKEGDVAMPGQAILTDQQVQVMNARLTCVGVPVTEEVKLIMNVQQLDQFRELRLPSPMSDSTSSI